MENIKKISLMESKCTGCGACVNVCPRDAIRLEERDGYFLFPKIDESKCNHCGLCLQKCPAMIPAAPSEGVKNGYPELYAAFAKDDGVRMSSSSGGLFTLLANWTFDKGGAVCGAAFVSGCTLRHVIITDRKDLEPLKGSKYVQSDPGFAYREIKELLRKDVPVLFVGTPCQVAACKSVVGDVSQNLLTVDLLCAGVPPQQLFKDWLNAKTNGRGADVRNVCMRDKENFSWHRYCWSFDLGEDHFSIQKFECEYFRGMIGRLLARRSCWNCRFSRFPRQGDFSIGDLWDVAENVLNIKDDRGVSVVCVNNEKARRILSEITDSLGFLKRVPVESVARTNNLVVHTHPHPNYERFWAWVKSSAGKTDICKKIDEYLNLSDGIAVLNFHDARGNYGSVLTAYALQEKIRQMIGFAPVHISLWDGFKEEISDLRDFTKEHILETAPCRSDAELRKLNRYFQTFIVGPDVVWKNAGFYGSFYKFLLDFAAFSKNICSYAPSFKFPKLMNSKPGTLVNVEAPPDDVLRRKRLMKRFNHVSVREDFGVTLCKEAFDVDAELVLDAALLLEAEDYEKLFNETDYQLPADTSVTYLLNWSNVPCDIADAIRTNPTVRHLREGSDFFNVQLGDGVRHKGVPMVDWLKSIHDCKCLITDSYHGMIFAILFKRPFVLFRHGKKTGTVSYKLDSLLRLLGIEGRFASTKEDFNRISSTPIDYGPVYEKLAHWRNVSENFLRKVLDDNKPNKTRAWMESLEIQNQILAQEQNAKLQGLLALYGRLSRIKHYIQSPRELIGKSLRKCLQIARGK